MKYQDLQRVHPTTFGIWMENGKLKSLQMTYPNDLSYDDGWRDNSFYYKPSRGDDKGNRALASAYANQDTFRLYCGYKSNPESRAKLKLMGLDMHAGKSFDLGKVVITGKSTDDSYVIVQSSK